MENAKRVAHHYKVGDLVLLWKGTENKYKTPYQGPFDILQVYDNGTVRLKVGAVEDTYNIRRLTPYTTADASYHGGECSMPTVRRSSRQKTPTKK